MIHLHEIGLIAVAFFSEVLGTLGGFGSSMFFVPLAGLFEDGKNVLVITSILHVFGNASKIWLFRRHLDLKVLLYFLIPSVLFSAIGAMGSDRIPQRAAAIVLGAFLILFSGYLLWRPLTKISHNKVLLMFVSGASGLLTGLVGTGGALRGLGLSALNLNRGAFIATSSTIDVGGDVLRAGIYLNKGYLSREHYFYIPVLLIVALLGSVAGKKILSHVSEQKFKVIVLVLIAAVGLLTLLRGIFTTSVF